jgi:hypothetical protein
MLHSKHWKIRNNYKSDFYTCIIYFYLLYSHKNGLHQIIKYFIQPNHKKIWIKDFLSSLVPEHRRDLLQLFIKIEFYPNCS